jgi:hypothetical protein
MATGRPGEHEYVPYHARYVSLVGEDDAIAALAGQQDEVRRLVSSVPPERETYRYAPGKWSVREVLGHLVDSERVLGYRAYCISRGELAALPAFDENAYVAASRYDEIPVLELGRELLAVRGVNLLALRRLDSAAWARMGIASGKPISVRALGFVMAGHLQHHVAILLDRYGIV